jgi:hypothetical protein
MTKQLGEKASPVTETQAPGFALTYVQGLVGTDIDASPLPVEAPMAS